MDQIQQDKLDAAFIKAVGGNDIKQARQLLEAGADVNIKNGNGWTALHKAAWWGHIDCMCALIEAGADTGAKDRGGDTPIDILQIECPDLYKKHIDELRRLALSVRKLRSEDKAQPADTGFEFDI